ncbi:L,D-transpeptidase [Roseisalinus antarcticus]|uniref:L,D-transpeptidase catalytic domain n=1 Tax=Roseisalinus antarcticus TaxID=254357 RepID=A0A1Y5RK42_9RHOB|nr:L,D-transpeptidase [Roseisalinus antarcticus]SLN18454.1 L,D-transpeptidase catalytic domain [Roseisalinus antarcticus]
MTLNRRHFLATSLSALAAPALASQPAPYGIDYLEGLAEPGALHESQAFIAPSALHEAYSHAIYVNTSFYGDSRQKLWLLERQGASWDLGLRDDAYWQRRDVQGGYSFPVSSGALHAGNSRAGPTPSGIFNIDERSGRYRSGWGSPGMYKAMYIDLHYNSGRMSGVAMHGTTSGRYSALGRPASHGCVRVTQSNMDAVHALFHPGGARREDSPLWGEVPRYFTSEVSNEMSVRRGYTRDGSLLTDDSGAVLTKMGYTALFVFFRDDV